MSKQLASIWACLLALSLMLAACASPAPAQPAATPIPVPTSTSAPTKTPEPTAIPTATSTATPIPTDAATATPAPTLTPAPQNLDQYGFAQFGLLKLKVADDSLFQDKDFALNVDAYPAAQKIIDRAILTAFAVLRSGSFDDLAAQTKLLQDDLSKGRGKFQVWAFKAAPDGSIQARDFRSKGAVSHLTVDPSKGIKFTFKTVPNGQTALFRRYVNEGEGWQYGVTDDGQLIVVVMYEKSVYDYLMTWPTPIYDGVLYSKESLAQSNGFFVLIAQMMRGHAHFVNGYCCEGKVPQLVGAVDLEITENSNRAALSLLPTTILWRPISRSVTSENTPVPTLSAALSIPTPDPRVTSTLARGQLVPKITGLQRGSTTFTLWLTNENPREEFKLLVYDLAVTDDISGRTPYEFDNAAMFDAGFAISVPASQTVQIDYVLKSPINPNAKVINFKIPNIYFSYTSYTTQTLSYGTAVNPQLEQLYLPVLDWQVALP